MFNITQCRRRKLENVYILRIYTSLESCLKSGTIRKLYLPAIVLLDYLSYYFIPRPDKMYKSLIREELCLSISVKLLDKFYYNFFALSKILLV